MHIGILVESGFFTFQELQALKEVFCDIGYTLCDIRNIRKKQYERNEIYTNGYEYSVDETYNTCSKICFLCKNVKTKLRNPIIQKSVCMTCLFKYNISKTKAIRTYKIKEIHLNRLNRFHYYYKRVRATMYQVSDVYDLCTIVDKPKPRVDRKEERKKKIESFVRELNIDVSMVPHFISYVSNVSSYHRTNRPCFTKIKSLFFDWIEYHQRTMAFKALSTEFLFSTFDAYRHDSDSTITFLVQHNQFETKKQTRRKELERALQCEQLSLRSDSKICNDYINNPDSTIELSYVVQMMKEMDWFFKYTSYQDDMSKVIYHRCYHRKSYNVHTLSEMVKKRIVRSRVQKEEHVPNFILERYYS